MENPRKVWYNMDFIEAGWSVLLPAERDDTRSAGTECRVCALPGPAVHRRRYEQQDGMEIDGIPGNALGAYLDGAFYHRKRQRTGRRGRHHERRTHRDPRQHRRRRRVRHAGR